MNQVNLTDPELLMILRRRAGMTHQDLAQRAGCNRVTVTQAEGGRTSALVLRALLDIVKEAQPHGNHSRNDQAQDLQGSALRSTQDGQDRNRIEVP